MMSYTGRRGVEPERKIERHNRRVGWLRGAARGVKKDWPGRQVRW